MKRIIPILMVVVLLALCGGAWGAAPTLSSAVIAANGTELTLTFSEAVSAGAGGNAGWTIDPSDYPAVMTYTSGDGTAALIYTISRPVPDDQTATISYVQPGDGIEADDDQEDFADITDQATTNGSGWAWNDVYVDSTHGSASDAYSHAENDADHPWATLAGAFATNEAGDRINIAGGPYTDQEDLCPVTGTAANPVCVRGYPDRVTIDGIYSETISSDGKSLFNIDAAVTNLIFDNLFVRYGTAVLFYIKGNDATIVNCILYRIFHTTNDNPSAIHLRQNITDGVIFIENNYIYNMLSGNGIFLANYTNDATYIRNNSFINIGDQSSPTPYSYAIWAKYLPTTVLYVENNFAYNCNGFFNGNVDNSYFQNNLFIGTNIDETNNGSGIYGPRNDGSGYSFSNNLLNHNTIVYMQYPIQLVKQDGDHSKVTANTFTNNIIIPVDGASDSRKIRFTTGSGDAYYHETALDYNLYYDNNSSNIITEGVSGSDTLYTLANWKTANQARAGHATDDDNSLNAAPVFVNTSGNLNLISDFALDTGSPGENAASDSTDIGADVTTVGPRGLVPYPVFSADDTTPRIGQTITFTDASLGIVTGWDWDFGDTGTSSSQNPTHTYTVPGTYDVTLEVTGPGGTDSEVYSGYITVSAAMNIFRLYYED